MSGLVKVLEIPPSGLMHLGKEDIIRVTDKARKQIRDIEEAKAECYQRMKGYILGGRYDERYKN